MPLSGGAGWLIMRSWTFLRRFGLLVEPGFVDPAECSDLCANVRSAPSSPARIRHKAYGWATSTVNDSRRTKLAVASPRMCSIIETRLRALQPALETHFNTRLAGFETPQFLVYEAGDYFQPHFDGSSDPEAVETIRNRKVSVSIFLNGQSEQPSDQPKPGAYCGGSLIFYGLVPDSRAQDFGFPIVAEPGLLVAFRSDLIHEVKPITQGERYSVVTWFS